MKERHQNVRGLLLYFFVAVVSGESFRWQVLQVCLC